MVATDKAILLLGNLSVRCADSTGAWEQRRVFEFALVARVQ